MSAGDAVSGTDPTPALPAPPADAPKPANPEPSAASIDPEKGRVKSPAEPGKSEHPDQGA